MVKRTGDSSMTSPTKEQSIKRQKKKKSVPDEILNVLDVVYSKDWQNSFAQGYVIEESAIDECINRAFFEKLQQVQLLKFFQKTAAVIAPREFIANFILDCKVEKVSSKEKKITYELPFRSKRTLVLTQTRFAHIMELATTETELTDKGMGFYTDIEWLGTRHISGSETYWSISEIRDPAMKDLYKYLTKCVFRLASNIKISRSQILPVQEALEGTPVDWTQYLWPKFVYAIERLKESGKHNRACRCNVAALVSAILYEHTNEFGGIWTQAWDAWKESEIPDKVKGWNAIIRTLGRSGRIDGDGDDGSKVYVKRQKKDRARPPAQEQSTDGEKSRAEEMRTPLIHKDKDVQESATTLVTLCQTSPPPFLMTDPFGRGTVGDFLSFNFGETHERLMEIGSSENQKMVDHFVGQGLPVPKLPCFRPPEGLKDVKVDDLSALKQPKVGIEDISYFQSGPVQRMINQLATHASVTSDVLRDLSRYNGYLEYHLSIERKQAQLFQNKCLHLEIANKDLQTNLEKATHVRCVTSQLQQEFEKLKDMISLAEMEHEAKEQKWNKQKKELEKKVKDLQVKAEQWEDERKTLEAKTAKQQKDLEASITNEATTADRVADLRGKLDRALTKLSQQEYQNHVAEVGQADKRLKKEAQKASLDIVAEVLEATNQQIAQWSESLERRQEIHGLTKIDDEDTEEGNETEEEHKDDDSMDEDGRGKSKCSSDGADDQDCADADGENLLEPLCHGTDGNRKPKSAASSSGASSRCFSRSNTRGEICRSVRGN